jgi:hypothetical protein
MSRDQALATRRKPNASASTARGVIGLAGANTLAGDRHSR